MRETRVQSPGREGPLEEGVAAPSSVLAWRVPGTEEPGGLQSTGSQSRTRLNIAPTPSRSRFIILPCFSFSIATVLTSHNLITGLFREI